MMLNQLICRAASVYPEAYVLQHWDLEAQQPKHAPHGGDTLAQFVALELADTFDVNATEGEQIAAAVKAMQRASDDLGSVAHALSGMGHEVPEN